MTIGERFGKLTLLRKVGEKWALQCDCGQIVFRFIRDVKRPKRPSCGCLRHLSPGVTSADIIGERFTRLLVIEKIPRLPVGKRKFKPTMWKCVCDCGAEVITQLGHLRNGSTKSCGCLNDENLGKRSFKHGYAKHGKVSTEYRAWASAKSRCHNLSHEMYPLYGARGITMSVEWLDSFETFLKDMGPRPTGMTLDRINNDGPYSRENCRWADYFTQNNNQRDNVIINAFGKIMTASQWAREFKLTSSIISNRIKLGWNPEEAVKTPRRKRK